MKIYARQVPPEYQEPPLFIDEWPENVFVFGNKDYKRHTSALFDALPGILDELTAIWDNMQNGVYDTPADWATELQEIAPPQGRPEYTREERKNTWPEILDDWNGQRGRVLSRALTLITGKEWDSYTLRGCCQGDWQECVFLVEDWHGEALEHLETEYFNTGSEWIIHDGDAEPGTPEDIDGFACYCHGWSTEQIKKEIAEAYGEPDAEVILYEFSGYTKTAIYTEV